MSSTHSPEPQPQSSRLTYHEFDPEFAADFFELNRDPDVMRFTNEDPFASVGDARRFLRSYDDYERNGFGRWALRKREDAMFVGWCGLKAHPDGTVDVGFRLGRSHWGQGFATEACLASLEFGFDGIGLETIVGRAMIDNHASHRVLLKSGLSDWKTDSTPELGIAKLFRITRRDWHRRAPGQSG